MHECIAIHPCSGCINWFVATLSHQTATTSVSSMVEKPTGQYHDNDLGQGT